MIKNTDDKNTKENGKYYLYIILCQNNAYYIGTTNNIKKRFLTHKNGKGSKYTSSKKVHSLLAAWVLPSKNIALSVEAIIKSANKHDKTEFINNTFSIKRFYRKKTNVNIKINRIAKSIINKINTL